MDWMERTIFPTETPRTKPRLPLLSKLLFYAIGKRYFPLIYLDFTSPESFLSVSTVLLRDKGINPR